MGGNSFNNLPHQEEAILENAMFEWVAIPSALLG